MDIGSFYQGVDEREGETLTRKKQKRIGVWAAWCFCALVGVFAIALVVVISRNYPKKEQEIEVVTLDLPERVQDESSLSGEITLEEIGRIKKILAGEFEDEAAATDVIGNVTNDLPLAPEFEIGAKMAEGYDWAVGMDLDDRTVCDQFLESKGKEFIEGCQGAVDRVEDRRMLERTRAVEEEYQKLLDEARREAGN